MKGVFIIRDKGVDTEYNEVDDIPAKFDKVIRFGPTGETESAYREKLDELLKRQKKMIFRNYK